MEELFIQPSMLDPESEPEPEKNEEPALFADSRN